MNIGAVDLFCGVGGLTCGLKKSGITVVAGIDLDESCKYAFEHNNNSKFIHKSVDDVTGKDIKRLLRGYEVKVLVGCAPCQPFSSHQKTRKTDVITRTGLCYINLQESLQNANHILFLWKMFLN